MWNLAPRHLEKIWDQRMQLPIVIWIKLSTLKFLKDSEWNKLEKKISFRFFLFFENFV